MSIKDKLTALFHKEPLIPVSSLLPDFTTPPYAEVSALCAALGQGQPACRAVQCSPSYAAAAAAHHVPHPHAKGFWKPQ